MKNHLLNLLLPGSGKCYGFIFNNETTRSRQLKKYAECTYGGFIAENQTEKLTCKDENYEKN